MGKVRIECFAISTDGYGAGPSQDLEHPLGVGGERLHDWTFASRNFRRMHGLEGGETGVDDDFIARGFEGVGAWILGRNMFGPVRGPWSDDSWRGWWGDEPPYRVPVFVLTHHARPPLEMRGGTTFHFVTDGFDAALGRAREAAGPLDVRIGGGTSTVRQALLAGVVDSMHLAISPVLLGGGESLLDGIDLPRLGLRCREFRAGARAMHLVWARA
jgi:dihydrofolate reductase